MYSGCISQKKRAAEGKLVRLPTDYSFAGNQIKCLYVVQCKWDNCLLLQQQNNRPQSSPNHKPGG